MMRFTRWHAALVLVTACSCGESYGPGEAGLRLLQVDHWSRTGQEAGMAIVGGRTELNVVFSGIDCLDPCGGYTTSCVVEKLGERRHRVKAWLMASDSWLPFPCDDECLQGVTRCSMQFEEAGEHTIYGMNEPLKIAVSPERSP